MTAAVFCGLAMVSAMPAAAADGLPPVLPGLWHITSLVSFEPDPQPGGHDWPGLAGKPRAGSYDICISESRARLPMSPPAQSGSSLAQIDERTLSVSEPLAARQGESGRAEWLYRRLGDKAFEGSWSIASPQMSMSLQYDARFLSPDCAGRRPSAGSKFGEP